MSDRSRLTHYLFLALLTLISAVLARPLAAATGQLELSVVDKDTGKLIPCRMHLIGPNKKPRKPEKVPFWHDHFAVLGKILLKLPLGEYSFVIERGPEYLDVSGHFTINTFADDAKRVELRRFINMSADGWWSGDVDVRRPVRDMELLMGADDLHVAEVITWRNDKRKANDSARGVAPAKDPVVRFDGDRYYQALGGAYCRPGNELLLLNLPAPLTLPAAKAEYPPLLQPLASLEADKRPWSDVSKPFWWDLPMLVAAGRVDSIEVAHSSICRDNMLLKDLGGKPRDRVRFPDPLGVARWSEHIYFQLLECGLRIPPTAGSGSGESPNPVGYNRVYAHVDGPLSYDNWWEAVRAGRVVVTNGPLLKPSVQGELPGHVFQAEANSRLNLDIGLTLSTREPISYLDIIKDGKVAHSIPFDTYAKSGRLPTLQFDRSGWFLVRAVTDLPKTYRFAMTGPYFVEIGYERRISKSAVKFFLDWLDERTKQIKLADPAQRKETLAPYQQAQDYWRGLLSKANAE